ncbi:MAG: hypothetical protein ACQEUT_15955 [Bacillota bacterium]
MNFVKEQVIVTEVQDNIIELEGLIAHQMENHWSEPNLVTTELSEVLDGIWLGMTTGKQLGTLSDSDKQVLEHLHSNLNQYPHDELYSFADVTEEDKHYFEELRNILREAGLGMRITISSDLDSFMHQAEAINKKLISRPISSH